MTSFLMLTVLTVTGQGILRAGPPSNDMSDTTTIYFRSDIALSSPRLPIIVSWLWAGLGEREEAYPFL